MNTAMQGILDQLLQAGSDLVNQGKDLAEKQLNLPAEGPERDAALSNMGKGALAAGAAAVLLGTKGGRKLTGTAATLGGLAVLGTAAYQAYQKWLGKEETIGVSIDQLEGPEADVRSLALLRAIFGAANADGRVDETELQNIQSAIVQLGLDASTAAELKAGLAGKPDPVEIANGATTPEAAAEIYLASLIVVDQSKRAERDYLDRLARAMNLDPSLVAILESRA